MYSVPEYFSQSIEITVPIKNLLHWASWVLTLPVIIFSCWHFMIKAFKNIILYQIGMDTPVSIGVLITFIVSTYATFDPDGILGSAVYFDSLTMFVFFILIGRYFELRLKEKTIGALDALINVLPSTVQRLLNSNSQQVEMIAIDVIKIGDKIRILPGECFPVDAILLDKMTHVEESLLTGESSAVEKHVGDKLLAGSYNLSNPVWVKVTQIGENTEFSKIVSLMESANATKPRVAIIADQIAKPFIVFIFIAAIFAGLFNIDQGASYALMIAASVLVVTCPCALSLATPAAIISAVSRLAKSGVLVKKFQAIENLSLIDVVIFDKTGTLSNDELHLDKIFTKFNGAKKIIAHRPLTDAPILEGVPLLPEFNQEDDVEELAEKEYYEQSKSFEDSLVDPIFDTSRFSVAGFKTGYNKAKETYKYTEEDIKKAIEFGYINTQGDGNELGEREIHFIKSLQQPKLPVAIECEMKKDYLYNDDGDKYGFPVHPTNEVKTTTNSQGQIEIVGEYIY
jgi:magnesium-transporting ATPase (P-type)